MMNEQQLKSALHELNLPGIRYFPEVGSTNDIAMEWAREGASEFSLVVADTQTAGRGRLNREWVTNREEGLAFSVVLRARPSEKIPLFSALGGIAVCDDLLQNQHLPAMIKWPNDVLVHDKKICGILAETHWEGLPSVVLGIGINVGKGSIPRSEPLNFPATDLETEIGHPMDRIIVLTQVLKCLIHWRECMGTPEFFIYWKEHLAFFEKPVQVTLIGKKIQGILKGISEEGNLQIQMDDGKTIGVEMGDVQLRPIP